MVIGIISCQDLKQGRLDEGEVRIGLVNGDRLGGSTIYVDGQEAGD